MDFDLEELAAYREEKGKHERRVDPALEAYIKKNYIEERPVGEGAAGPYAAMAAGMAMAAETAPASAKKHSGFFGKRMTGAARAKSARADFDGAAMFSLNAAMPEAEEKCAEEAAEDIDFESEHESKLKERMRHLSDTFSQYLLYLIEFKGMENAEVYKRAIVDKKIFSKIKNNADYHPQKITALCLCVGAKLNLDETKDLLARAGYALSPCDKTDIIFSYFIENGIYDMIELDIQLEEHGLPCIIS